MSAIIKIKDLNKRYNSLKAVDNISLEIYKGEILGLLGPNGAGKTTLIHMLCGLLNKSSGEVNFLHSSSKKKSNRLFGVCPQENIFWPKLSCKEQLQFMGQMYNLNTLESKKRANELLEFLGLEEKANILAKKLSGGMKRRLSICLALVHDPEILILDEPEAGLDPQSRILVRNYIKSLTPKKTILLSTHNMDEADRMADRVAIMNKGQLLLVDTPTKLKKSIGDGDQLEIIVDREIDEIRQIEELEQLTFIHISGNQIRLKSKNIIENIPRISKILTKDGYEIKEMVLRENSLEDVFIHLTGERLAN